MELKILAANLAFGFPRMDTLRGNLKHHIAFHGANIVPFAVTNAMGMGADYDLARRPAGYRIDYLAKHSSLKNILNVLAAQNPDIIILSELIFQKHRVVMEEELKRLGFTSFCWALMSHHPEATVSTLVAAKTAANAFTVPLPQRSKMGCGGSLGALRLRDVPITVFGLHLGHPPKLWKEQLKIVASAAQAEQDAGRSVIVAGDFNQADTTTNSVADFAALHLVSANRNSGPTFVHFRKTLDHIFIPAEASADSVAYSRFGSDHMAVAARVRL